MSGDLQPNKRLLTDRCLASLLSAAGLGPLTDSWRTPLTKLWLSRVSWKFV